jgi:hypothetical protein
MRSRKAAIKFPAARTDQLLVETIDDETVVYDLESKEAHCLKGLASFVFANADGRTSAQDLEQRAADALGAPVSAADVQDAIHQLDTCALLDTPLLVRDGLSRRDVVRKAGYVGAAAVGGTLITSILAPTAAMAASNVVTGCIGCGKNHDCTSNHCCQDSKGCNQGCCVEKDNSCHSCPTGCGALPNPPCSCTVQLSTCPCICGTAGCNGPCCPPATGTCCQTTPTC